jgi:hypothetical protein
MTFKEDAIQAATTEWKSKTCSKMTKTGKGAPLQSQHTDLNMGKGASTPESIGSHRELFFGFGFVFAMRSLADHCGAVAGQAHLNTLNVTCPQVAQFIANGVSLSTSCCCISITTWFTLCTANHKHHSYTLLFLSITLCCITHVLLQESFQSSSLTTIETNLLHTFG